MWIIIALLVLVVGVGMLTRANQITRILGASAWAEKKFGVGGTPTLYRMIGFLLMLASFFIFRYPSFFGL